MNKLLLAALAASLLASCVGPGELVKIPVSMPDGGKVTIVAHKQKVPDWMLARDKLALNYVVKGEVSEKQLAAVADGEHACRIYAETVRPSNLVAVASQGVLYFGAGYLGVGLGSQAFTGAKFSEYAYYGGLATGMSGTANGLVSNGGQTYTFENCGREIFDLFPQYQIRVLQKSPY